MLHHACGYKLATDCHDTPAIQAYLGHATFRTMRCGIPPWRLIGSRSFFETDHAKKARLAPNEPTSLLSQRELASGTRHGSTLSSRTSSSYSFRRSKHDCFSRRFASVKVHSCPKISRATPVRLSPTIKLPSLRSVSPATRGSESRAYQYGRCRVDPAHQ
jgi:hypothetical protein